MYLIKSSTTTLYFTCVSLQSVTIQLCSDGLNMVNFPTIFSLPGSNGMLFGSGDLNVKQGEEYYCKIFPFDPHFSSDDVRVQLAVTSKKYEAAVTWIGDVTKTG